MKGDVPKFGELLAGIVKASLRDGVPVEIDGLGVFEADRSGRTRFIATTAPKVFVAYVQEDFEKAAALASALEDAGMKPWLDRRKLLPGQNWPRCIERAIDRADFFVACFSKLAVRKRGQFPFELRYALRCADRMPLDDSFIVPVRLDECDVPRRIASQIQYVDLFPDRAAGVRKLVRAMRGEYARRRGSAAA
jgi:hypothetical protein